MNILLILFFAALAIALVVFLIFKNQKDRKDYEQQQNSDYKKTKDIEGDIDTEEKLH